MIESGSEATSPEVIHIADRAIRQCVVYLSIVALAFTGLGYDPYLRIGERRAAAEAEAEAENEGFYAGIEEEAEEDDDVVVNYQPNIYVARIAAPVLICGLIYGTGNLNLVRRVYGLGHALVVVCYQLFSVPKDIDGVLLGCGFASEIFWSGKMLLYYYQIVIYSRIGERLSVIIYGVVAQSLGAAVLPWIVVEFEQIWEHFESFLNVAIAMIQFFLFYPCDFWTAALKETFEEGSKFKFREVLIVANIGIVVLSTLSNVTLQWFINNNETLLRALLPFFVGDEFWETFWNIVYNVIAFTFLGFFCIFLSTYQLTIASFLITFLTGVAYLYLEEDIAARMAIPMTAFTFGVALVQLLAICRRKKLIPLMGAIFTVLNLATYGYFGLLWLFWNSPDIVLVVVWAANGFYALILLILSKELGKLEGEHYLPERDGSGSFHTIVTTIT